MKKTETIDELFERSQTIINELQNIIVEYSKAQYNMKILDRFPKNMITIALGEFIERRFKLTNAKRRRT